ncbi:oxidative stress-responsive serine-rich protein 1 [Gastrophryne carolinensis]
MESEARDGDEENLQSAFKKLRVDAGGSPASLPAADGGTSRACARPSLEDTKPKVLSSLKDSWHGSSRKTTRGSARTPRRRRSKSPVLHPAKFTHCSAKTPGITQLKGLCDAPPPDSGGVAIARPAPSTAAHPPSGTLINSGTYRNFSSPEPDAQDTPPVVGPRPPSDFGAVGAAGKDCQCENWSNMRVYSFSGLRDMLSECEKEQPRPRTRGSAPSSGSPRSCSEQARASVDDVTIEDLAGYMEYYLYIPKKMSHMAEMMYT